MVWDGRGVRDLRGRKSRNGVVEGGMCERRVSDGGSVWKRYLRYLKSKQ